MRTGGPLTMQLMVPCLARNRAYVVDMFQEAWPTIVVLCFTATANGSLMFLESRKHGNFSPKVGLQPSL